MEFHLDKNSTINEVLKKINDGDVIYLNECTYHEKIKITNKNIKIIGKGKDKTFIVNKDYSPKIHADNKEYNTFRTYTVMVTGENVELIDLSIKNLSKPAHTYGQAVALHVLGDNFKLTNSGLYGAQDTLFCGPLPINLQTKYIGFLPSDELTSKYSRQLYTNCYIEGNVDFIFGGGISIFNKCKIHSIESNIGYITAPSHNLDQKYGFTFLDCEFTCEGKNKIYLGRPWRDYGCSAFLNCKVIGDILDSRGFDPWNNSGRDKTARFSVYNLNVDTSTFAPWVTRLSDEDITKYTIDNIFNSI